MGGLLFGILMVCLVFGIPIAVALLTAVFQCVLAGGNFAYFQMIVQRMFIAMDSVSNAAVPFFILAGNLMEYGGISKRLIGFVRILMKKIPASLSCITVGGAAFFGAISGSNAATVSAIGGIMVPQMQEEGYPSDEAAAVAASAGTLGVIIPPQCSYDYLRHYHICICVSPVSWRRGSGAYDCGGFNRTEHCPLYKV